MLAQVTLTQAAGILFAIVLAIGVALVRTIGIPIAIEWWQRRRERALSTDSDAPDVSESSRDRATLRHAAETPPVDLRPILLMLLAIDARKQREAAGREAGSVPGSCESLHISDKGLSKGQWAQLERWVRGGKKGLTQAEIATWMAKRDQTISEAVRMIEAQLAAARRTVVEQQRRAAAERTEPDYPPQPVTVDPYVGPLEFLATQPT